MTFSLSTYRPAVDHYDREALRVDHEGLLANALAGTPFVYGRIDQGSNFVQIGLCQIDERGLNIQHQPLENVHHLHLTQVAHKITTGAYRLFDGPLTRKFFPLVRHDVEAEGLAVEVNGVKYAPLSAVKPAAVYNTNAAPTKRTMGASPRIADMLVRLHRQVFGCPEIDSAHIAMPRDGLYQGFKILVRHDKRADRISCGLALRQPYAGCMEFVPFADLRRRQIGEALERWSSLCNDGGVSFAVPAYDENLPPNIAVDGEQLAALIEAVRNAASVAWPEPLLTATERRLARQAEWDAKLRAFEAEQAQLCEEADAQPGVSLSRGLLSALASGSLTPPREAQTTDDSLPCEG